MRTVAKVLILGVVVVLVAGAVLAVAWRSGLLNPVLVRLDLDGRPRVEAYRDGPDGHAFRGPGPRDFFDGRRGFDRGRPGDWFRLGRFSIVGLLAVIGALAIVGGLAALAVFGVRALGRRRPPAPPLPPTAPPAPPASPEPPAPPAADSPAAAA